VAPVVTPVNELIDAFTELTDSPYQLLGAPAKVHRTAADRLTDPAITFETTCPAIPRILESFAL